MSSADNLSEQFGPGSGGLPVGSDPGPKCLTLVGKALING